MQIVIIIQCLLIVVVICMLIYTDHQHRKERQIHLDFIDRLQNKLMSRDFTEYSVQSRQPEPKVVTNPLMARVRQNMRERGDPIDEDDRDE